jgi:hypothetical protein
MDSEFQAFNERIARDRDYMVSKLTPLKISRMPRNEDE